MKADPRIHRTRLDESRLSARRRGFTLVELLVAGVITAFVLGSLTTSLSQLARARNTGKLRFDAHIRADAALNAIRKDIASIVRSDDLFFCRFLLTDDTARAGGETFDRDEVLLFTTRIRPLRNIDFSGEGFEYETQYRIADDDAGPVLWVRHDAMPDEYPAGGGQVKPLVEGILGLSIEAYDGYAWYEQWDSDSEGLPVAVRVTVLASGHRGEQDVLGAPRAILRTVISIDRVLIPRDQAKHDRELIEGTTPDEQGAETTPEESGGEDGGNLIIAPDGTAIQVPDDPNQRPRTRGGGQPRSEQR